MLQVDTLCHRGAALLSKCRPGRVQHRVHRCWRTSTSQSLMGCAKKRQNKDLGISRDAAGVEARPRHYLGGLHPRLPDGHALRSRSPAISKSSSGNCPVDILEFFFPTPLPEAGRTIRFCRCAASRWIRISTNTSLESTLHHVGSCQDGAGKAEWEDLPRLLADLLHGRPYRNQSWYRRSRRKHGLHQPAGRSAMRWSPSPGRCRSKASIRCNSVSSGARSGTQRRSELPLWSTTVLSAHVVPEWFSGGSDGPRCSCATGASWRARGQGVRCPTIYRSGIAADRRGRGRSRGRSFCRHHPPHTPMARRRWKSKSLTALGEAYARREPPSPRAGKAKLHNGATGMIPDILNRDDC